MGKGEVMWMKMCKDQKSLIKQLDPPICKHTQKHFGQIRYKCKHSGEMRFSGVKTHYHQSLILEDPQGA